MRILRDPLVHFLLAGLTLFVLVTIANPQADSRTIVVDEQTLLAFIQYRNQAFDKERARRQLNNMSASDRERVIREYVEEEVMHREALALRLEENDYVIRRRLVQKMEFVADELTPNQSISSEQLEAFFEANRDNYFQPATITFSHVFLSAERRGWAGAREAAIELRRTLQLEGAGFEDAPGYGDRFLYAVNYVDRSRDFVASRFNPSMADKLFALTPSKEDWQGPFESPYGAHLALVVRAIQGGTPDFVDIRQRVRQDVMRSQARLKKQQAIDTLVSQYTVKNEYEPVD